MGESANSNTNFLPPSTDGAVAQPVNPKTDAYNTKTDNSIIGVIFRLKKSFRIKVINNSFYTYNTSRHRIRNNKLQKVRFF